MEKQIILGSVMLFLILFAISNVYAQEEDANDPQVYGLELEKLLNLVNGLLALALFFITFIASRREHRPRLLWVSIAFLIFAIGSFLVSHELFFEEIVWLEPLRVVLDFVALLTFFYAMFKK